MELSLELLQLANVNKRALNFATTDANIIVAIQCEELDDPANGRVQVDGTRPGATATYLCNAGFNLIGQKTRVCQNDGSFAGQAPTCERKRSFLLFHLMHMQLSFASS